MVEPRPQPKREDILSKEVERKPLILIVYRSPNNYMKEFSQVLRNLGVEIEEIPISHQEFQEIESSDINLAEYLSQNKGISLEGVRKVFTDGTVGSLSYGKLGNLSNLENAYSYLEVPKTLEEFKAFLLEFKRFIEDQGETPIVFPFLLGDHLEYSGMGRKNWGQLPEELEEEIKKLQEAKPSLIPTEEDYKLEKEYVIQKYNEAERNSRENGIIYTAILRSLGYEILPPSLLAPYGSLNRLLDTMWYIKNMSEEELRKLYQIVESLEKTLEKYSNPTLLLDHHVVVDNFSFVLGQLFTADNFSSSELSAAALDIVNKIKSIFGQKVKIRYICPCCLGGEIRVIYDENGSFKKVDNLYGDIITSQLRHSLTSEGKLVFYINKER